MTKRFMMILAAMLLVTSLAAAQANGKGQANGLGAQALGVLGQQAAAQGPVLTPEERIAKRVEMMTKVLDLTEAQAASITAILTKEVADMEPLRAQLETLRGQLKDAVQSADLSGIDTTAAAMGTVHGQIIAIQAKTRVAILAVLTPEQIAKLEAIREHFGDRP